MSRVVRDVFASLGCAELFDLGDGSTFVSNRVIGDSDARNFDVREPLDRPMSVARRAHKRLLAVAILSFSLSLFLADASGCALVFAIVRVDSMPSPSLPPPPTSLTEHPTSKM